MFIVEGECTCLAAWSLGQQAVAIPGAESWKADWAARFAGMHLVVVPDLDNPGRALGRRIADDCLPHASTVRALDLEPRRDDGYDIGDLLREAAQDGPTGRTAARERLERAAELAEVVAPVDPLAERRLDVPSLLSQPIEPIPWRCDRLAADGYLTLLTGRGGEGKSWLALAMSIAVQRGATVAGIACERSRAIYFDAENGRHQIARRLRSAGVTEAIAPVIYDCTGLDFQEAAADFEEAIRVNNAQFAVFDSLRAFCPGARENESDDMAPVIRRFVEIARTTKCAVLLIHHRPKAEDGSKYRGSSTIEDQTDLLFVLDRKSNDPERRTRRFVQTVKCRIDEEPETRWLEVCADRAAGRVTIDEAEPYETDGDQRAPKREAAREALRRVLADGPFPSQAEWIRAADGEPEQGTWKTAASGLMDDGEASKTEAGIVGRQVGQSVSPPIRPTDCPPDTDGFFVDCSNGAINTDADVDALFDRIQAAGFQPEWID